MSLTLREVLDHPTLRAADPLLRTCPDAAAQTAVRWVHSSEVLNIAPLLRGGELLLTGGESLGRASEAERRAYVMSLAERHIAALAVEVSGPLPSMPADMIETAADVGLPLIELRRVIPFISVAEAINSSLVSESVERLQRSDVLSHDLAVAFANGATLAQLVSVLAAEINCKIILMDRTGRVLESSDEQADGPDGPAETDTPNEPAEPNSEAIELDVPLRGIVGARLQIIVGDDGDADLARSVGERGIDVFSLALMKFHAPTLSDAGGAELIRAVVNGERGARLVQLADAAGISPLGPVCAVSGRVIGASRPGSVERLLSRRAGRIVMYVDHLELVALVALDPDRVRLSRSELMAELAAGPRDNPVAFAVGPVSYGVRQAARSLREARLSFEILPAVVSRGAVVDAEAVAVERLTATTVDPEASNEFLTELIGELLSHDEVRGSRLVETLDTWLGLGCNTAEAARVLHLERQSMHNRLQKIFALLGGDPRGSGRLAGLHMATALARQRSFSVGR